ncbi:FtsB family cell division protein [Anaerovorax odorimutans]|uniref:FtsB family cell division protein n=1 Tax=Anaerovorax odorimutans TaxID=109327 RepID=UPI0003F75F99|nr:septum formation initiator family protein [Anaerovorax odorimutans]
MLTRKKRRSREFKDTSRVIDMAEAREDRRRKRKELSKTKAKGKNKKYVKTGRAAVKTARKRLIYTVIFILIITVVGMSAYSLISLRMNEAQLKAENKKLNKEKDKLEYELSQIDSDEYIEQQARQMLRMIKPGEILYVIPDNTKKSTSSGIIPE